jgi:hypothetical protein
VHPIKENLGIFLDLRQSVLLLAQRLIVPIIRDLKREGVSIYSLVQSTKLPLALEIVKIDEVVQVLFLLGDLSMDLLLHDTRDILALHILPQSALERCGVIRARSGHGFPLPFKAL